MASGSQVSTLSQYGVEEDAEDHSLGQASQSFLLLCKYEGRVRLWLESGSIIWGKVRISCPIRDDWEDKVEERTFFHPSWYLGLRKV